MTTARYRNCNMNPQAPTSAATDKVPGSTPLRQDDQSPAVAAINFSLRTTEGLEFLRAWRQGDWDVIRREWPEAPESVFVTALASPLFRPAKAGARERLFENRVPEAAARQCATVLAWLTECNLATLEGLRALKSTSAARLRRQQSICDTAVAHCIDLGIEPTGLRGDPCVRLIDLMRPISNTEGTAHG